MRKVWSVSMEQAGQSHSTRSQERNHESSMHSETPARRWNIGFDSFEFRTPAALKPLTTPPGHYHDPTIDVKRICEIVIAIQSLFLSRLGIMSR